MFASGRRGTALKASEYEVDGRIYGMAAAEVFEVEVIAPGEGDYILVDHEFADAQKGAVGHIRVRARTARPPGPSRR